jgi:hypothetical protein
MNLVYAYRCGEPTSGLDALLAEHERVTMFWDAMVQIDRAHEQMQIDAAAADVPAIAEQCQAIETLSTRIRAAFADGRKKSDAELLTMLSERRGLFSERRTALNAWRKSNKPKVREIEVSRQQAVKRARQSTDAWWPNYNLTIQRYDAARQACRQKGRRLRLHDESRDDGVLAVQIQRTPSGLGAAPDELQDGTVRALQIGYVPDSAYDVGIPAATRRERRRTVMEMRVDADGHCARLPITLHRPLPDDCRVKSAQLTWRKGPGGIAWQLCLTLSLPDSPVVEPSGEPATLALSWASQEDGGLLVATCGTHRCVLDARWQAQMDYVERLHAMLDADDDDPRWAEYAARMARVAPGRRTPRELAEIERAQLWQRLLRRRREVYRLWAREIVRAYGAIVMDDTDLSRVATDEARSASNSLRQRAAPHTLRQEIVHQARKASTSVTSATAPVLAAPSDAKSSAWARRKAAKVERSQILAQPVDAIGPA